MPSDAVHNLEMAIGRHVARQVEVGSVAREYRDQYALHNAVAKAEGAEAAVQFYATGLEPYEVESAHRDVIDWMSGVFSKIAEVEGL